jgi:hypothetical protein
MNDSQRGDGRPARWKIAGTYGYAEAVTTAGTLAAPVLAGFSITLIVVVIQAGSDMGAPGAALDLLAAAVVALVLSVQAAFIARIYLARPSDILEWWPDATDEEVTGLREEQRMLTDKYRRWASVFRRSYNLGLLLLIAAVTMIMMPPSHSHHEVERWIGFSILAAAFGAELLWMVGAWVRKGAY